MNIDAKMQILLVYSEYFFAIKKNFGSGLSDSNAKSWSCWRGAESYSAGHADLVIKVKTLSNRLDAILGKQVEKNQLITSWNCPHRLDAMFGKQVENSQVITAWNSPAGWTPFWESWLRTIIHNILKLSHRLDAILGNQVENSQVIIAWNSPACWTPSWESR